jgi:hypothetical protein
MATGDSRSKQSGTTRPSGTTAKAQTKSPIGPGSGYLQPKTTTQKTPFDPKSLTKSNKQIVETIKNRGTTVTDTSKGTGKDTGKDKGIAPLTFTDTDNGDGTITRRYSDGTVEIIAGGRGAGQGTDPATAELLRRDEANRKSAFKVLEDTFNSYGLGSLVPVVRTFMEQGLSDDEAVIQLRQTPEYKQRFLGNEGRRAKGLYAYSEAQYLEAEQTYRDLLAQSGLETLATADTFSKLIGGAVSPAETQDRIQNVFNRIDNADPQLREQIGGYLTGYGISDPNLQRTQLASALLMGGTSAQDLVRNIEKAQIKTAALTSGVAIGEENISSLQKQLETAKTYDVYGTSKKAFGELAQTMPTTQKLSQIYGDQTPGLAEELQQEAFFGLQSQRRKKLQEKEKATFGGQSGTSTVSLAQRTTGAI